MLEAIAPTGALMRIPENLKEDRPYFRPDCLAEARTFYEEQGYVVLRGLVPADLCPRVRAVFDSSVRASRIAMLRQKNMRYERNAFDGHGFLQNPIFNVQDLGSRSLGAFRDAALNVLTHRAVAAATASLLGSGRHLGASGQLLPGRRRWAGRLRRGLVRPGGHRRRRRPLLCLPGQPPLHATAAQRRRA